MRILVVDDDAVFRQELAELLREERHKVEVAPSVAKALETLEREEVDLVLTDLKMPRQSGLDLLRDVRNRWPRTLVIMITGFGSIDSALDAMKAGAFDYLRKPFRIEQLRAALELATQQRAFETPSNAIQSSWAEARELARNGDAEVLYIAPTAPPPTAHVQFEELDPDSPSALVDQVRQHVVTHSRSAVVLAGIESVLERYRLELVLDMLHQLRELLQGHGPLRVSFDPTRVSPGVATAVAGAVAANETQATIEAFANPIRRKALERLERAPASFGALMEAAGLDDSPKMSFHLRKLADAGLVDHDGPNYRLTTRGRAVLELLTEAILLPPADESANRAFAESKPAKGRRAS